MGGGAQGMTTEPRRVHIDPGSEIGKLLDEARNRPVLLEKEGVLYRVSEAHGEDIWAGYDAEAVKKALRQSAGAFAGSDTVQLRRDILLQREQDSHGRPA